MDWLTDIIKIFLDNTYKINHKLWFFISASFMILIIDNHLGISSHLYTKSKIEEIEKIEKLLESKSINPQLKQKLSNLENEIIDKKNIIQSLSDIISRVDSNYEIEDGRVQSQNSKTIIKYSIFYHILTNGYWVIMIEIFFLMIVLGTVVGKARMISAKGIMICLLFNLIAGVQSVLTYLFIPKFSNPTINYSINFLISTCILLSIVLYNVFKMYDQKLNEVIQLKYSYENIIKK
ncbi:hypothetical protein [Flectobacillus roseus]|uniref:hypothetical protein n=1 Tax=Flectobacillus roseus TaxID=502259 RepID=UPI0024B76600|nr:hypothetical protein [Flectobacillus roseus]MDI9870559.1 hypothetical protein [Flectobacillus roseus]